MRIVKLSSLSEKERKKVLEEQEERYQQNQQERQRIEQEAHQDFVNRFGNGDTNPSHTTTYRKIMNAMDNKQQRKSFQKSNGVTLWDQIKTIAGIGENIGLGAENGIRNVGNYMYASADYSRRKSMGSMLHDEMRKVQNSKELTDEEKKMYFATHGFRETIKQQNVNNKSNIIQPQFFNHKDRPIDKYGKGNIDLTKRPIVKNEDGSISTVRSMSFEEDGKEILVPTVVNGKIVSAEEAIEHYHKTGEYLGKFNSVKEAEEYAQKLHEEQEKMYTNVENNTEKNKAFNVDIDRIKNIITKNPLDDSIQETNQKIAKNIQNQNTLVSKKLAELAPSIGNMGVGMVASAINPVAGGTYFGLSAAGSYMDDAKARGMNEQQAITYGALMGAMEGVTEMVGVENIKTGGRAIKALVSGSGKQALKTATKETTKAGIKEALKNFGIGITDNFVQESIMEPIQEFTALSVAGGDKADFSNMGKRMLQSGIDGALTSIIMSGAEAGSSSCIGLAEKVRNGQTITQQEVKQAVNDAKKSGVDVQKTTEDSMTYWMNKAQQIINESSNDKVINQENKMAQNGLSQEQITKNKQEQIKIDSENFSNQIEQVKNGNFPKNDMLTLGQTPQVLKDIGLPDLPITMTQKHLDTIMNESGKYKGANYHNLGEDVVKQLPEAINNPLDIVKSNTQDDSIVLTTYLADKQDRPVIASIKIDGKGTINDIRIDTNVMTSAYGRNNYDKFMQDNIKNGNLLYDIDRGVLKKVTGARLQLPRRSDFTINDRLQSPIVDSNISNNSIPQHNQNVKSENTTINNMQNVQENIQQNQENTKGQAVNWNEIERPEENRKFRKHYKSIIESDNTTAEAKVIAKELMGTDTYVPETNKGELMQADERIATSSPEVELKSLISKSINNEKISPVDIATGERLIQYFSKTGSKEQLQEAIQATALAGTRAGQTVQALAILNHQTPQGQATWIQRSVEKINKELAKKKGGTITKDEDGNLKIVNKQGKDITDKVKLFDLTPEMMNKIMQSENQEQMLKNIDEVYEELGQQVPKDMIEKIDSWRYFSMLANARTHIRNMVGNVAMGKMQRAKDKIAGGIEDVVSKFNPEMERTKTLRRADKKVKEFAKNDFKNVEVQSRLELNESKFKPQSRLQNARRTFKSDVMENTLGRLFDLNDTLLEAEDGLGLKAGYQKALADYLTANKIDVDNITDAQLGKARNYAIQQAKEATFHQANALASWVSQIGSNNWQAPKGKMAKFFVDAVLPFKKTPMNVAKSGVEYSPVGLLKSAIFDTAKLRKGDISANQYIDNISKGLTGTGIALTGYALAKAGILKASGGDDKDKEKYDEEQGKQSYSIEIAGKTYSLDWLAPTGIPLFVGAETYSLFNQTNNEKSTEKSSEDDRLKQAIKSASNLANAGATAINPMSEMSMISGLTNALTSYNSQDGLGNLGNLMTNAGKSYVNQFFPTLMGQVAKTGDEYERTTKSTATGTIGKAVDQTINQIKNKIPGLRQTLPIKTDIWGKDVKQEVNLPLRAIHNFINPATVKGVSTDEVDAEINKLYEVNKNNSLLPDILQKKVTLNGTDYRWTNEEYAEYSKKYGTTSYKLISDLIKSSGYKSMTNKQNEDAISKAYDYAKEKSKVDYANKVNEEIETSTLYDTMEELSKNGGNQGSYLNYLAKTQGMKKESEKLKVLADSNYDNTTKKAIYSNGIGKQDKAYEEMNGNVNINSYLKYKSAIIDRKNELKNKGKLKENQDLPNKQKIELLSKTKYSSNEKKEIYSNYINNKDELYNNLSKLTDINIDAYLDYKMQDIKGNDDPDSDIEGKTKTGTKKKNFIKYIQDTDFSEVERLYIYGKFYKYNQSQQTKMKDYIKNADVSSKEKLEVYKQLSSNIEEHEDGNYYWKKPAKK